MHWWIQGNPEGQAPMSVHFLQLNAVPEKMAKIIGWRPTFGVSATSPRLGNPGSATDTCYRFKDWMKLLRIGKKLHALVSLGRD